MANGKPQPSCKRTYLAKAAPRLVEVAAASEFSPDIELQRGAIDRPAIVRRANKRFKYPIESCRESISGRLRTAVYIESGELFVWKEGK
jgi:hypothetical protein